MFPIIFVGLLLGTCTFSFIYILSKKNEKYYLAPMLTFLMAVAITAYGLLAVGGFEGMAYGVIALCFLIVSIVGTLCLPLFFRRHHKVKKMSRLDKISLVILPVLFFSTIGLIALFNENYWIINTGETDGVVEGYTISTIMEGKKQVSLQLGEGYKGKKIKVKKVSKYGPTEIIIELIEGGNENKAPSIQIGLDKIVEPITVQTNDGEVFKQVHE